jgi:3-hydroxybutyryl-CoA dehydrogenase
MGNGTIKKVGVIGAGLMGSGIAQVAATRGFAVTITDVNDAILEKGLARIQESLERLVELNRKTSGTKGVTPAEKERGLAAITGSLDPNAFLDVDIIIEAAIENEPTKKKIIASFSELGYRNLLVSNTSSISITRLASAYAVPEQFMGMHFMNPVPMQAGCELVRGADL